MTPLQVWREARNAKRSENWPAAFTRLERAGDALAVALEDAEARMAEAGFPYASRYQSWPDLESQMSQSHNLGQKVDFAHRVEPNARD